MEFALGSRWAYRAASQDELIEVEVLRLGVKKPARLLVRWVANEFEGHQDWVPPSRLKVPRERVDDLRAWASRWAAAQEPAAATPELLRDATDYVIESLVDPDVAEMGYNAQRGVIKIHQVDRLAALLDIDVGSLRADPRSFEEAGTLIAPITAAIAVAQSAASAWPVKVLAEIEEEEAQARHDAAHGRFVRLRRKTDEWIPGEVCERIDAERQPLRNLLREWCGAGPGSVRAEIGELREEAQRLRALTRKAIDELRASGHRKKAADLEQELLEG
ncbi:MAG: hypothetical protein ACHQ01_05565 [Candidatus Limnocylindrales bacterium]